LQTNAAAVRGADATGDPANQTAEGDGLSLAVRRESPASAGKWLTEAGRDLV
jgi:hypothetical protein